MVDIDVACREPERAARAFARARGGAPFPLSERHGAWRIALEDGRTVDFTPLPGAIEDDLAGRDFTLNAMARPLGRRARRSLWRTARRRRAHDRAVSQGVFEADPLRLLRAVRLEDELGFRIDAEAERLVRRHAELASQPAGERILGELGAALHRRLPAPRGAGPARRPGRLRRSCSTGSTSPTHPSTDSCACSGSRCGGCRSRAASTGPRPHAARRRATARRFTACDPSLPARDRAVGPDALAFVGSPSFARQSSGPAPPIRSAAASR